LAPGNKPKDPSQDEPGVLAVLSSPIAFTQYPMIPKFLPLPGGFFFAVPSSQISAQSLVCLLLSLGYRAQVFYPEPLYGPDNHIGLRITFYDNIVWITQPGNPLDFFTYPFKVWVIGGVQIIIWEDT
jgi:hypothetical protein